MYPQSWAAHTKIVGHSPRAPQVELLDLGSPFASEPNVVTYNRHVRFTSDDPTGATRHRASGLISTTWLDEAFVHKMPEELVGLIFAQADLVAYVCDLGFGGYLVPSTFALLDSPEHRSALVIGKLCRHYAPLPLVPLPIVRLPDRTATCSHRCLPRAYPKTPNCMFLPTGESPATKASSSNQGDMGVSVRGFSCPSSGVPHLHVVQRLLLPSLSSGALLVRAVHGLLPSVLRAACAPLVRGSSPRARGDT